MQQQILEQYPAANIRVYTVWFSMLSRDERSGWDAGLMPDARVTQWWDTRRLVSRFVAQRLDLQDGSTWQTGGFTWDTYLLYGPDARWDDIPTPLHAAGGPVIRLRRELAKEIAPLVSR